MLSTGTSLKWIMNNIERFKNKDIFTLPLWGMVKKRNKGLFQENLVVLLP